MVTLEDISLEVGCSVNTVSKALNNKPDVSEATRKRIIEAAKRLGYVPNFLAKSLVTKTTGTIGVVVPSVLNPAYTELIESLTITASRVNYSTFLAISSYDEANESGAVENFYQKRVDGLIIIPVSPSPEYHETLERFDVPVVYLLDDIQDASSHFVGVDMKECALLAASRLLDAGRRRLALVTADASNPNSAKRMIKGFEAALTQHRQSFAPSMVLGLHEATGAEGAEALADCDGLVLEYDALLGPLHRRFAGGSGRPTASGGPPDGPSFSSCLGTRHDIEVTPCSTANYFDMQAMAATAFDLLMRLVKNENTPTSARKIICGPLEETGKATARQ